MALLESGEMYLETIYVLSLQSSSVRSIDVAEHLGYSKPSVSRAVGLLKKDGLLLMDEMGYLKLTESGEERARRIAFFVRVLLDEAERTAQMGCNAFVGLF